MSSDASSLKNEELRALFAHLVMTLASSAMQHLGQMPDPTGQAGVNLDGAQAAIDMLEMMETKTKGNLDADESRMLRDTISSLQLTFVETRRSEAGVPAPGATPPAAPADAEPEPAPPPREGAEAPDAGEVKIKGDTDAEQKPPRFHKSYD